MKYFQCVESESLMAIVKRYLPAASKNKRVGGSLPIRAKLTSVKETPQRWQRLRLYMRETKLLVRQSFCVSPPKEAFIEWAPM